MAKYNDIRALAEFHAREISRSPRDWTGYLDTAARLYRYDFADSLLIHAQRPDATACAELETWNSNLGDGEYTAPGAIQYSTEEAEAYAALFADISTYATQCSLSFLTGDMSLEDDWDTYLANLEQLGLSDWLEVCQSAYDRYRERVAEAVSE